MKIFIVPVFSISVCVKFFSIKTQKKYRHQAPPTQIQISWDEA